MFYCISFWSDAALRTRPLLWSWPCHYGNQGGNHSYYYSSPGISPDLIFFNLSCYRFALFPSHACWGQSAEVIAAFHERFTRSCCCWMHMDTPPHHKRETFQEVPFRMNWTPKAEEYMFVGKWVLNVFTKICSLSWVGFKNSQMVATAYWGLQQSIDIPPPFFFFFDF